MKVFAPKDSIRNPGTKYRTIDSKFGPQLVNPEGSEAFAIRKGEFQPIPFEWEPVFKKNKEGEKEMTTPGLELAKERFDPEVFEFFKTKEAAAKACKKEEKLLKMLPMKRLKEKQKRAREKLEKSKYGQKKPTMDDVVREAKKIGVDIPLNIN